MRIIYLLGLIAGIYLASFSAQRIFHAAGIPIDLAAASGAGQIVNYLIVLICAFLFTIFVWRQSVIEFLLLYSRNWRKTLGGFAFCAGLTLAIALLWYAFVFGAGGARWSSAAWAQADAHMLANLFGTGLVAIVLAITEEILFRSLAFKYLLGATTQSVIRAAVLSSIIFALAHHFDDPQEWLDRGTFGLFIGLFLLGCLLALVYYTTNSLACAIGMHTGLIWVALTKKTAIIQIASSGWQISNLFDPRTQPASWILFVLLAVVFWSLRRWTAEKFSIEDLDAVAGAPAATAHASGSASRDRLVAIVGVAACIAGFLAVQTLIDRQRQHKNENFRAAVAEFENTATRGGGVDAAARAAGFRPELYIKIAIDSLRRLKNGQVEMHGWAAYVAGDGTPVILFVLAGNTTLLEMTPKGRREDAARAFKLTDAAARDINFDGVFSCRAAERLQVVTTTSERTYFATRVACP